MEKRKHKRSHIQLEIELVYPDGERSRLKTSDLSIGGFYVEATGNKLPELGTFLMTTFLSVSHKTGTHTIKARVQRLTHNGIAMTFVDFSLEDLQFLDAILSSTSD